MNINDLILQIINEIENKETNLSIAGGRGYQFGLAASVTTIIFLIVLFISAVSFRYSMRLERVYGNL